jgi:outer membrane protein assembly factor BamA
LPISERFFSGGSTTLRGFNFEEAGPRRGCDSRRSVSRSGQEHRVSESVHCACRRQCARSRESRSANSADEIGAGSAFLRWRQRVPAVGDLFGKEDTTPVPPGDILAAINKANLRAHWTNTVGLGFRLQTPFGGALAVDYGFLLNPPEFLIPQRGPGGVLFDGTPAIFRLHRGNLHFRITQTF